MATATAIAPKIAPITEPTSDAVLRPEELLLAFVAADVLAGEVLVLVSAGEALVDVGPEITAEGDATPRLV